MSSSDSKLETEGSNECNESNESTNENEDIDIKQVSIQTQPSHANGVDNNKHITASNVDNANNTDLNSNHTQSDIIIDDETNDITPNQSLQSKSNESNPSNDDKNNNSVSTMNESIDNKSTNKPKVTGKKRKREKTRWGPPPRKKRWGSKQQNAKNTQSLISNLIKISHQNQKSTNTAIASAMFGTAWNENQTKIFLLKNQLQDVSTRLIAPGAFAATEPEENRSPSPEPIYDQKGVRINTREYRLREKLQKQRISIIQQLIALDPNYQPPPDYKPPKLTHKIMMPVDDYPDYNFFGLIVGPRGNTQKEMQKETGCKIAVRGQGACLDKPGRLIHPDDNEPLHVHITAPNQESMDKAIKMITDLLEEVKTGGGEHKAKQLRELATINGTLRIESRCRICGGQHPIYRCPEKTGEKWTPADVQCKICGELTHVTEDCKHYRKGKGYCGQQVLSGSRPSIDAEYTAFMQELIGDAPMSSNKPIAAITAPPTTNNNKTIIKKENIQNVMNGNYHNVPPPSQNGAKPPTEYKVDGSKIKTEEDGTQNGKEQGQGQQQQSQQQQQQQQQQQHQQQQQVMGNMAMMHPMAMPMGYPPMTMGMTMPMMAPGPYGMMAPGPMYGGYPMGMTMNPYMSRPPMPPFPTNGYRVPTMAINPYPQPPPPPNNGQ